MHYMKMNELQLQTSTWMEAQKHNTKQKEKKKKVVVEHIKYDSIHMNNNKKPTAFSFPYWTIQSQSHISRTEHPGQKWEGVWWPRTGNQSYPHGKGAASMVSEPNLHQEGVHDRGEERVFHTEELSSVVSEAKWGEEYIQTERREERWYRAGCLSRIKEHP